MAIRFPGTENPYYQQNLTLLKIYTSYRVILSAILLLAFALAEGKSLVGGLKPVLFTYTISIYLLLNVAALVIVLPKKFLLRQPQLFSHFFIDVIAITFIVDASGGLSSGLGVLYIVCIAASSTLLRGQVAFLVAALASILILADTFHLISQNYNTDKDFLASGSLGLMLFATSLFIQTLSQRIRKSREQAAQSAADASKLERLNQMIVQRMRTGIAIVDKDGGIKLANRATGELLGSAGLQPTYQKTGLPVLHASLLNKLQEWKALPQSRFAPIHNPRNGFELQVNFTALTPGKNSETLVFLEDNRRLAQQAQQIKLASLGRLTASIAHEIRNPLSAINHAAQLLGESTQLDQADQRLTDIIQNHSRRMDQIVENVLQLSRRKTTQPERIELKTWLDDFVSEYQTINTEVTTITTQGPEQACYTNIDPSQLHQVLTNLFDNGLRYSQKKTGKASLVLRIDLDSNNDMPYLDIIDHGKGISEEDAQHLFEPFFTTEANGTGLGLFISRELCEANQARLNYLRNEQELSCFRISFSHPDRRIEEQIEQA
jgi:two-component system sensor histidine kinase PilS (NtrC family)